MTSQLITATTPPPSTPAALMASTRLDQLLDRWIAYLDVRPQSAETYIRAVRQFILWMQDYGIDRPRREDILAYRRFLAETRKPTTVQNYIIALRQFFRWLELEGVYKNIADHIKGAKIERVHKKDYLTSSQAKSILSGIDRQDMRGRRDYALLSLMITGGLRTIEVCRADVGDIGKIGDNAVLYLQSKGKDEKTDYVKLPGPGEQAIREHLRDRWWPVKLTHPLFMSMSNNNRWERMTTRSIRRIAKDVLRAAGHNCNKLSAHSFRHTAITLALLGGQSLQEVQQFARHSAITTTMIYAHNIDRAANKCAETVADAVF